MKKLFVAILALCLLATLSVTAFASNSSGQTEISQGTEPKTGSLNVNYTVDSNYTVTIPTTVTLGGTAKIKAENVKVKKGEYVEVKLTGTSGTNNAFILKTGEGAEITYTVEKGGNVVNVNDAILTVSPGENLSGDTTLTFVAPADIKYAGTYTGTVTFTVSVGSSDTTT